MTLTPEEVKNAVRESEVAEALWRFFFVNSKVIQDCQANEDLMLAHMEDALEPISYEGLEKVYSALTDQQKAEFAPATSTNRVKPRTEVKAEAPPPIVTAETKGILPPEYTRARIAKMDRDEMKELIRTYDSKWDQKGAAMKAITARWNREN